MTHKNRIILALLALLALTLLCAACGVGEDEPDYGFTPLEPHDAALTHGEGSPLASDSKTVSYYVSTRGNGSFEEIEELLAAVTGEPITGEKTVYLNQDRLDTSGSGSIPLVGIDSMADIERLKSFSYDRAWDFLADSYDEAFFETKTLFLVSFTAGSGSHRYDINKEITVIGDELCFTVTFQVPAPGSLETCDVKYWLFLFEIDRVDIAHCTQFDAKMIAE